MGISVGSSQATLRCKDCVDVVGTIKTSRLCGCSPTNRKKCGNILLRTVELASSKRFLYPYRVCCYQSVLHSLQEISQ